MGIFIYKLNNDKLEEIKKSTELQTQVINLNNSVSDLQDKIDNISKIINNNSSENNDKQKIISILKNVGNLDYGDLVYFNVLKINYENGTYSLNVSYNTPILISENELKDLKKNKTIILNNEEYKYIEDNSNANGYIQKNNEKYEITKYNDGYAFILSGTAGGYTRAINKIENMEFIVDENTIIYDSFTGQEYKINSSNARDWINKSLDKTIVRLNYSTLLDLSIFIDNK